MILNPYRPPSRPLQQLLPCPPLALPSPSALLRYTSASIPSPRSANRLINPTNLTFLEPRNTPNSSLNPTECAPLID